MLVGNYINSLSFYGSKKQSTNMFSGLPVINMKFFKKTISKVDSQILSFYIKMFDIQRFSSFFFFVNIILIFLNQYPWFIYKNYSEIIVLINLIFILFFYNKKEFLNNVFLSLLFNFFVFILIINLYEIIQKIITINKEEKEDINQLEKVNTTSGSNETVYRIKYKLKINKNLFDKKNINEIKNYIKEHYVIFITQLLVISFILYIDLQCNLKSMFYSGFFNLILLLIMFVIFNYNLHINNINKIYCLILLIFLIIISVNKKRDNILNFAIIIVIFKVFNYLMINNKTQEIMNNFNTLNTVKNININQAINIFLASIAIKQIITLVDFKFKQKISLMNKGGINYNSPTFITISIVSVILYMIF